MNISFKFNFLHIDFNVIFLILLHSLFEINIVYIYICVCHEVWEWKYDYNSNDNSEPTQLLQNAPEFIEAVWSDN